MPEQINYVPLQSTSDYIQAQNGEPVNCTAAELVGMGIGYYFMNHDNNPPSKPDLCRNAPFTVEIDDAIINSTDEGIIDGRPPIRI